MAGSGAFRLLSAPLRALGARWVALVEPELTRDPACAVDADLLARVKPHHRRAAELAMSDLCGRRHEAILRLPAAVERALCARVLSDPRDLPIFLVFLQVAAFHTLSSVLQITLLPRDDMRGLWWGVPQFLVGWIVLGQRFILAMHYAAHRPIFSPKKLGRWAAGALNAVPQTLLSNLYGMPAGAYYVHHCIMHHQANNVFPYDISSTMPYRRDSPLHFLMYVANFMVHTLLYLPYYALSKRRFGLAAGCLACLGAYLAAYPLLYRFHPVWFVNTLGHSFWLGPFALMLGNWSQHVFVDPQRPTSNYGLATNHLGAPFNMLSFNDGYHITHHVSSITHWSEMPRQFIEKLDQYETGDAILFERLNFNDVGIAAFCGERGLRKLAKHAVQLREIPRTEEELVALFRQRLQPLPPSSSQALRAPQLSAFAATELMWVAAYWLGNFPLGFVPVGAMPVFHLIHAAVGMWTATA